MSEDPSSLQDVLSSSVRINSLTISQGARIELGQSDLLVIVGPNNSGKSQFLRDVEGLFKRKRPSKREGVVVKEICLHSFSHEDLTEELEGLRERDSEFLSSFDVRVHTNSFVNFEHSLSVAPNQLGDLAPFFLNWFHQRIAYLSFNHQIL